jgi:Lamin Tail Domain/Secretion system C-terminal sorting domain
MKTHAKSQCLLLIGAFYLFCTIPIFGQKVYISEVFYDSPLSEENDMHNGEFIELYNPSDASVNLQGWSLSGFFPKEIYTFGRTILPPKSYLIVAYKFWIYPYGTQGFLISSLFPELIEYEFSDRIRYQSTIRLSNRGETILLKDNYNNIADQILYYGSGNGISTPALQEGQEQLYARNRRRDYKNDAYNCLSLFRSSVSRDQNGNALFQTSDWGFGAVTPLGIKVSMPGYESFNSLTSEDVKYLPKYNYANAASIEIPEINDQPAITQQDGDILYFYDANGNRKERVIYLSKTRKATVKSSDSEVAPIENDSKEDIHIYPNPTKGLLKLEIKSSVEFDSGKIYLFDNSGKLIISDKVSSYSHSIDLGSYSSGIYIMKVLIDKKAYVWKIIKE